MNERIEPPRRRRRFQYSLATLLSVVIFANLGFAIWQTGQRCFYLRTPRQLTGHSKTVWSMKISPDGRRALSQSEQFDDYPVILWDVASGEALRKFKGWQKGVFSPDRKHGLSVDNERRIRLWDVEQGQNIKTFKKPPKTFRPGMSGYEAEAASLAVSPDGQRVLVGYHDGSLRLWDIEKEEIVR